MSLNKLFIYSNKVEASTDDPTKFSAYAAEARNRGWKSIEAESFPPVGFYLTAAGELIPKTEKQKVESGEIKLADLIEAKCAEVSLLCRSKIVGGIRSSALGEEHIYPSDETDQQNLICKVTANRDSVFKCTRVSNGEKDYYPHTPAQFRQALEDGDTFITNTLKNSTLLQKTLRAKTTYEGVQNFDITVGW